VIFAVVYLAMGFTENRLSVYDAAIDGVKAVLAESAPPIPRILHRLQQVDDAIRIEPDTYEKAFTDPRPDLKQLYCELFDTLLLPTIKRDAYDAVETKFAEGHQDHEDLRRTCDALVAFLGDMDFSTSKVRAAMLGRLSNPGSGRTTVEGGAQLFLESAWTLRLDYGDKDNLLVPLLDVERPRLVRLARLGIQQVEVSLEPGSATQPGKEFGYMLAWFGAEQARDELVRGRILDSGRALMLSAELSRSMKALKRIGDNELVSGAGGKAIEIKDVFLQARPLDPAERISNVAEWKAAGMRAFDIHLVRTQLYRATVPRVRRALANCATYMIFDDHEVTDDWNLSQEWFDRVTTSPLGRTVVRNALSAYTLFQAWGNDPKKFESGANKDMLVKLPLLIGTSGGPVQAVADAIDAHLGMSAIAGGDPQPPDVDWHYTVDGPLHRTVVIETRTRRTYAGRNAPAKLLGTSLNAMVPAGPLTDGRELLIVVAPQPPLMPALFDQIAQPLGALSIDFVNNVINVFRREPKPLHQIETGAQTLEAESWGLEELGLEDFLKRVAPYQRVVILSGDVHFSATLQMDYWRKGQPQADRIVQLITSPSKNAWRQIVVNFVRSTSLGQTFAELGMPGERLAWNSAENVLVPPSVEGVPPGLLARMRRSPALLPAKNWPMGTVFKQKDGNPVLPDWRWRLDLVVDQRPDGDRPIGVQLPPPGPDIDPADPLTGYYQAAGRHQVKSAENYTHLRRLIFPAAIGVVTFPEIAGKRHVRHVLLSRTPGDPNQFAPNTVHETSLEPTTDPQPEIQFQPEAAEAESG
jgi:hypothetical protein